MKAFYKILYCDMDGVLADFDSEPDGINRFQTEPQFFLHLQPFKRNCQALRNAAADGDKRRWLKRHRIKIADGNFIAIRLGERKVDYMKTTDGILFDDYSKNIHEWLDGRLDNGAFKVRADGDLKNFIDILECL